MYAWHIWYDVKQNKFLMSEDREEVSEFSSDFNKYFSEEKVARTVLKKTNALIPQCIKVCPQCKRIFWLGKDEQDWYSRKGLRNPKKCITCRHMSREAEERTNPRVLR